MQKAIVVYFLTEKKNNVSELNQLLADGWKVVSQNPMSGSQSNASLSLVIVEK
ncbi:hypothetical protein DFQ01_13070 [Paenibacillus cellulosilyticus]|uniref:DUF4177 domain-containing protein n=1 Tax=Paenibacillus cellulosilyticus TaxID=375489 RepID=A0A2V2YLL0_9BACL|nr:hypothetical protein [Paenibacillus cellulosilyticus]PWV94505.1 hypothetical protein DFQ01_13070 [Paenibacillus cellulosilyticus]QKS45014.1 hypothetical protein HUB94_11770 [Paenibacillus cellulosilyticus]